MADYSILGCFYAKQGYIIQMTKSESTKPNSVREYVFDIGKIVEGALRGDQSRVLTYSERLCQRLSSDGEIQSAQRLSKLLKGNLDRSVHLADIAAPLGNVPVDSESRLPIADFEHLTAGDVEIVLDSKDATVVNRFIETVRLADRLVASGISVSPSMLIYGPPGVGKTLLARFISSQLGLPLLTARTDALISSYLGSTAKNIRQLFDYASSRPCVLFLDEFDAIAKMRDDSQELGELKRVVISLLQNIDALGSEHVLVAATNHEHLLDAAVWRRFGQTLKLAPPSKQERAELFARFIGDRMGDDDIETMAILSRGLTGAGIRSACDEGLRSMIVHDAECLSFEDISNALIRACGDDGESDKIEDIVLRLATRLGRSVSQDRIGRIVGISQSRVCRILKQQGTGNVQRTALAD